MEYRPTTKHVTKEEEAIAKTLTEQRIKSGISCDIMAEVLGVNQEQYLLYELGKEAIPASILFLASVVLSDESLLIFDVLEK